MNCNSCRWINEITPKEYNNAVCHPPVEFHCLYPYRRGDNFYCVNFEPKRTCQNCSNAHKPEWCGYGADTCGNFEKDEWISVQDKLPAIGDRVEMLIHSGDYVKTKVSSITIFDDGVCFADVSGCSFRVLSWRLLPKREDKFKIDISGYPLVLSYGDGGIGLYGLCIEQAIQLKDKLNELWMSAADK